MNPLLLFILVVSMLTPALARDGDTSRGAAPDEISLYDIDSVWRDGAGRKHKFSSFGGQVRVLAMGFTSCLYACPRIIADMRTIEQGIDPKMAGQVAFTFVSFDPARDTPATLARFQEQHGVPHWTFLTSDADSALDLSVVLGVKYQKVGLNDFAHSNTIFVIGSDGRILHRQENLGTNPDRSLAAIRKALATKTASAATTR